MDNPFLTLVLHLLVLVGAPVIIGLAASTWTNAALYSGLALYLVPLVTYGWELYEILTAGADLPDRDAALRQLAVLFGSAIAGAILGLAVYALKRLCQAIGRLARRLGKASGGHVPDGRS